VENAPPDSGRHDSLLASFIKKSYGISNATLSISLGDRDLFKPVVQILSLSGEIIGFVKIGWDLKSVWRIKNELLAINFVSRQRLQLLNVPVVASTLDHKSYFLYATGFCKGQNLAPNRVGIGRIKEAVCEISSLEMSRQKLIDSIYWIDLLAKIRSLENMFYQCVLKEVCKSIADDIGNRVLSFCFSHGDLVPWNIKCYDDRLFLYDWEYARHFVPPGWDAFHFEVQVAYYLKNGDVRSVWESIHRKDGRTRWIFEAMLSFGCKEDEIIPLFYIYTVDRCLRCLEENSEAHILNEMISFLSCMQLARVVGGDAA